MDFLRIYDSYNRKIQPLYVQVYLKPPLHPYKEIEENIKQTKAALKNIKV